MIQWRTISLIFALILTVLLNNVISPLGITAVLYVAAHFIFTLTTSSRSRAYILYIVLLLCLALIGNNAFYGFLILFPSIFFIAMMHRKQAQYVSIAIGSQLINLLSCSLVILISYFLGFNVMQEYSKFMTDGVELLSTYLNSPEQIKTLKQIVNQTLEITPSIYIFALVISTFGLNYIANKMLSKSESPHSSPIPLENWKFPRGLVYYYIVFMALSFFEIDAFLTKATFNVIPLLQFAFAIQGISFLVYFFKRRSWKMWLLGLLTVASFIFIPILYLVGFLGMADLMLTIRKKQEV